MTVNILSRLAGPIAAASGDNTLLTVDTSHKVLVQRFHVVNSTSSTTVTVKVGLNASADANLITPSVKVPAKQMLDVDTYVVMNDADTMVLNASSTGVTVTVYGIDQYPHL